MWELRRLTTLWAFTACYRDSFTFLLLPYCHVCQVVFFSPCFVDKIISLMRASCSAHLILGMKPSLLIIHFDMELLSHWEASLHSAAVNFQITPHLPWSDHPSVVRQRLQIMKLHASPNSFCLSGPNNLISTIRDWGWTFYHYAQFSNCKNDLRTRCYKQIVWCSRKFPYSKKSNKFHRPPWTAQVFNLQKT
jgi:hypothetical protein